MTRRIIALSLVAVLALVAPAGAEEATVGVGTAQTALDLADVTISGLPIAGLNLGGLTSYASTVPDAAHNVLGAGQPFALSTVRLPVGGEVGARSDGNTSRPGQTIDLGVGSLTVGELLATVDETAARSVVNALAGTVDAGVAGLGVSSTGANSAVSATNAAAVNGAMLHDLSLDLTDILPLELLQLLPLDVLIGLLDELGIGIDLPATLARTLRDVRALVDQLEAVDTVHDTLDATRDQLKGAGAALAEETNALEEAVGGLTALVAGTACTDSGLLNSVGGVINEGNTIIDGAKDTIGGIGDTIGGIGDGVGGIGDGVGGVLPFAHDPCHALEQSVAGVQLIESTIAALDETIKTLQTTLDVTIELLNGLLDELLVLIEGLDVVNLPALLQALIDGLAGAELLGIERLSVGVTSFADAHGSGASTLCELRGLRVLGQPLADGCAALEGALADVTGIVSGLLAELPISGIVSGAAVTLPDIVSASAPAASSSEDNAREGDFFVGSAVIDGLRLHVASLQLTQVTDALLGDLLGQVDAVVGELSGVTGIDVDLSAVDAAVDEVLAIVNSLPTGDLLAGVTTPGLALAALDLGTTSQFSAAGSGLTPIGTPGTPGAVPGTGQTPTPARDLPTTGGGVAMALVLLLTGAGAMWWVRRRPAV